LAAGEARPAGGWTGFAQAGIFPRLSSGPDDDLDGRNHERNEKGETRMAKPRRRRKIGSKKRKARRDRRKR
jgi:hypothetical protein